MLNPGRTGGALEFVKTLKKTLNKDIRIVEVDAHINDETFAQTVCSVLFQLLGED